MHSPSGSIFAEGSGTIVIAICNVDIKKAPSDTPVQVRSRSFLLSIDSDAVLILCPVGRSEAPLNPRTLFSLLLGVIGSTLYAMGDLNSERFFLFWDVSRVELRNIGGGVNYL